MAQREVHHGDGVAWLDEHELARDHAVVTSLPDLSELPELDLDAWRLWFIDVVTLIGSRLHPESVAIFYQTDIKHHGRWVDKAFLVQRGAESAGLGCLWHKVVCRKAPGKTTFGRPAYGHWLAFSKTLTLEPGASTPDVLPELGTMTWSRAMPMSAAMGSCSFLKRHSPCRVVVDPFCGRGTILAVANDFGFDAVGVELSKKRVRKARRLTLESNRGPG